MIHILTQSLTSLSQKHTTEILGDRSEYIGASELGACPRKVVLSKTEPVEPDLATLLRFKRGHLVEELVAEALAENGRYKISREVELAIDEPVPVKGHIDFLFEGKTLGVLEVKSVTSIPDSPYQNWEMQLHAQMGLLAQEQPQAQIKGAILAIDLLNGGMQLFNGYTPNEELFQGLLNKAQRIWQCLTEGTEPDVEPGPLCGWCNYKADCPAFDAPEVPEGLSVTVQAFIEAKKTKQDADAHYKKLQEQLVGLLEENKPVKAGSHVLTKRTRSSTRYDYKGIAEALESAGRSLDEFKSSNSYSYIQIK